MSNSREIEINNVQETTVKNLLDEMYKNKGKNSAYLLLNGKTESSIIVCMENDNNYIFIPGEVCYYAINPSKLALRVNLSSSLGITSDDDNVGYSVLNENRASLAFKCFNREEEIPSNSTKPGYRC